VTKKVIAIQCKFKKNDETVNSIGTLTNSNPFGFARNVDLHCVFQISSDITQVAIKTLTDNFNFSRRISSSKY
jgi:hypothetical protein